MFDVDEVRDHQPCKLALETMNQLARLAVSKTPNCVSRVDAVSHDGIGVPGFDGSAAPSQHHY